MQPESNDLLEIEEQIMEAQTLSYPQKSRLTQSVSDCVRVQIIACQVRSALQLFRHFLYGIDTIPVMIR
jgi:hypothetical protein